MNVDKTKLIISSVLILFFMIVGMKSGFEQKNGLVILCVLAMIYSNKISETLTKLIAR